MMVIYRPVKFEFDSKHFRVRVRKQKCGRTDAHINLIGRLVTHNPPKNACKDKVLKQDNSIAR